MQLAVEALVEIVADIALAHGLRQAVVGGPAQVFDQPGVHGQQRAVGQAGRRRVAAVLDGVDRVAVAGQFFHQGPVAAGEGAVAMAVEHHRQASGVVAQRGVRIGIGAQVLEVGEQRRKAEYFTEAPRGAARLAWVEIVTRRGAGDRACRVPGAHQQAPRLPGRGAEQAGPAGVIQFEIAHADRIGAARRRQRRDREQVQRGDCQQHQQAVQRTGPERQAALGLPAQAGAEQQGETGEGADAGLPAVVPCSVQAGAERQRRGERQQATAAGQGGYPPGEQGRQQGRDQQQVDSGHGASLLVSTGRVGWLGQNAASASSRPTSA